jgi:histone acetyltransferase HTATIP
MVKFYKNQHILHITDPIIARHERMQQKSYRSIDSDSVIWKP